MKSVNELNLPDDVRYTKDHEWARPNADRFRVGISDFAQDQLGDIVFVELPEVGAVFKAGDEFGTVESVKAVSELYMPMGGEVVEVNGDLADAPEKVNNDPYGAGWMLEIITAAPAEYEGLMDRAAYFEELKGSES
jgi:glycine cleavage system H protein